MARRYRVTAGPRPVPVAPWAYLPRARAVARAAAARPQRARWNRGEPPSCQPCCLVVPDPVHLLTASDTRCRGSPPQLPTMKPNASARPPANKLDESTHRYPRWSARNHHEIRLRVGGPGDVQVDPGEGSELLEEPPRRDGPGSAAAGVLQVRDVGLDQLAILVPERQLPGGFTRGSRCAQDFPHQAVVVA